MLGEQPYQRQRENMMDTELVARLRGVISRLARVLNDTSTGDDLTPTQYSLLGLIHVRGPLGLAELIELEGLNPTMLSRVVKVLDERGLVRRMQDPDDLRAARVAATPEGAKFHEQVRARRTKVLSDCLADLSPDTEATLLAAVPALETLAEALKPPAKPAKG
jgi:DNA-binding MarR family transcriptional regulator